MPNTKIIDKAFLLKEAIGKGGMAKVYLAETIYEKFDYIKLYAYTQVSGNSHAEKLKNSASAAKKLAEANLDPETLKKILEVQNIPTPPKELAIKIGSENCDHTRFLSEWSLLICLSNPYVIEVYGGGEYKNRPYYAMEIIENILSSEEIINECSLFQKLKIISQAANGLSYLHKNGIIHRDIKPSNLLVNKDEQNKIRTKITDLGLALNCENEEDKAKIVGTPFYMAPEQATKGAKVDALADIYSLGATLYHFVSGIRPYNDKKQIKDIIVSLRKNIPPKDITELAPNTPYVLANIIRKAMAMDPNERYRSMEDFVKDIKMYVKDEEREFIHKNIQSNESGRQIDISKYKAHDAEEISSIDKSLSLDLGSSRLRKVDIPSKDTFEKVGSRKTPFSNKIGFIIGTIVILFLCYQYISYKIAEVKGEGSTTEEVQK